MPHYTPCMKSVSTRLKEHLCIPVCTIYKDILSAVLVYMMPTVSSQECEHIHKHARTYVRTLWDHSLCPNHCSRLEFRGQAIQYYCLCE